MHARSPIRSAIYHPPGAAVDHAQTSPSSQPIESLTAREEEMLVTEAPGRTNNEVADEF